MRVLKVKDLEDCFDGSFIKELEFDIPISKNIIDYFANEGLLDYYPDFERPFYKITHKGLYIIKGVEGNSTLRLILSRNNIEGNLNHFIRLIDSYILNP